MAGKLGPPVLSMWMSMSTSMGHGWCSSSCPCNTGLVQQVVSHLLLGHLPAKGCHHLV